MAPRNRLTASTRADTDLDGAFDAEDFSATTAQSLSIAEGSNRLLGFTQTLSRTQGTRTLASTSANVAYSLDAAGKLTSDGLRSFNHDASGRLAQVRIGLGSEEAATTYLHNALGQRVFKSEPQATQYTPDEEELGSDFIAWLKKNFGWLFAKAQANATLGQSFVYADAPLPEWALLGEYGNGGSKSAGRLEILWLPTEDGGAIPIGLYRNGRFYAVHPDHLGTPRLITDDGNKPVWQWPYSAFGANKPSGILKATPKPKQAWTNEPVLLKATNPAISFNLRYPGQYFDEESNLNYNYFRSHQPTQGRYTQSDPIGLDGGWNPFGYVGGNSLSNTDPSGLDNPGMGPYGPFPGSMGFRRGVPADSCTCMVGSNTFYAPPGTNFNNVRNLGNANGWNPMEVKRNVGHWGSFDFQRDPAMNQFTSAYTNAANFAVGVYMQGAGYSRASTRRIAGGFARAFSSNAGDPNQSKYWMMGWDAANSRSLEYVCQ